MGSKRLATVTKALNLLELIAEQPEGLSLTEVAGALRLPKSSAVRYLMTLEERGYLEREPLTNRYRLGLQLLRIATISTQRWDLHRVAFPIMLQLRERFSETVNLGVPRGRKAVYMEVLEGLHPLKASEEVGGEGPLHATALGKAMLAFMPSSQLENTLLQPLERYTEYTITDLSVLQEQMKRVRERGFAVDDRESNLDLRCVGAPLLNARNEVVGGISISGPATRISLVRAFEMGPEVSRSAQKVSALLGYVTEVEALL